MRFHKSRYLFQKKFVKHSNFISLQGRIEIKIDDDILLGMDMNYLARQVEYQIEAVEDAALAAALMNTIMNLLNTLKNSFKNMELYKGSDDSLFTSDPIQNFYNSRFAEPDVSFEYFRYSNGKTLKYVICKHSLRV